MSKRCRQVWGNNAKHIPELIDATDESTILEHNLYARQPDSLNQGYWGEGRVTLVGDAAHCMRPGSGLLMTTSSLQHIYLVLFVSAQALDY